MRERGMKFNDTHLELPIKLCGFNVAQATWFTSRQQQQIGLREEKRKQFSTTNTVTQPQDH